jgi:lipopolysaccharide transport system ATP-binding protein
VSLVPGELVLEHASRSFAVRADQGRTIKRLVMDRSGSGPPPVHALKDVSLRIAPGETVGLVGRNGAGKTSTLKVLAGIVPLHSGRVEAGGRVVSLLELGAGFSRDLTGWENAFLGGAIFGMDRSEIEERLDRIQAFSELGDFLDLPVRTYSQGMFLRLGFSIAAHLDPDVLLIDEVLAVGDESFQRRCIRRISEQIAAGTTLVLVSHDPGQIERVCERVVVLDGGEVLYDGPTAEGLLHYHRLLGVERADGSGPGGLSAAPRRVRVVSLDLRDGAGRRATTFAAGGPLRVALTLEGEGEAEVVLEVRDEQGATVFRTHSPQPLGDVVWEVERLALLGGDYDLAVSADGGPPERVVRFGVAEEPDAQGVADLRGTWSPVGVAS